eukprot:369359_1
MRSTLLKRSTRLHQLYTNCNSIYKLSISYNSNTTDTILLETQARRFNNLYLDLSTQPIDTSFSQQLDNSISKWQENGTRALWAYIPSNRSHLIPTLIQRGFDFHYANTGFVLMSKWMSQNNEPNKLPHTPSTIVGVAGVVHNENEEILLVQEKHTFVERKWKFPGGLADAHENIDAAITREVYEETGIKSTFKSIMGFRHQHGIKFGGSTENCIISDFYIVCRLVVSDKDEKQDINICESEIYDAQWISLNEFIYDIDSWPINKEFAALLNKNINAYKKRNNLENIHDVRDMKLACDLTINQLESVAVPGSKYNLYYSDILELE